MQCEKAIQAFLNLDHGEPIPPGVQKHIDECAACRRQVAMMQSVFRALAQTGVAETPAGTTDEVMAAVRSGGVAAEEPLSVAKWLATGVIIFASIVLVSFSNSHSWLSQVFGVSLELPLSLILGAAITIYASLFIGTHVDEVAGFFGLHERR
jgi:predicted anti-sigma-YlaC factor YlaD